MLIFVNVHAGTIRSVDVSRVIVVRLLTVKVISNDFFFFLSSLTVIILRLINIKNRITFKNELCVQLHLHV